jgi:hypothetical protein
MTSAASSSAAMAGSISSARKNGLLGPDVQETLTLEKRQLSFETAAKRVVGVRIGHEQSNDVRTAQCAHRHSCNQRVGRALQSLLPNCALAGHPTRVTLFSTTGWWRCFPPKPLRQCL